MSRVLLNTRDALFAKILKDQLIGQDFEVSISNKVESLISDFNLVSAHIVLLEVRSETKWNLEARLRQLKQLKQNDKDCRIVLIVDEKANPSIAEKIIQTKVDGLINDFIYTSVSGNYFLGVMKSLQ